MSLLKGQERKYKVYTALLTQTGTSFVAYISSDDPQPLTVGVTYTINLTDGTGDFTNVGAPDNNLNTSFVATGTTPSNWGTPGDVSVSYDTGAPIVTVLENTIGNIWFTYDNVGAYNINSDNLFIENKTYSSITNNIDTSIPSDIVPSLIVNTSGGPIQTYSISNDTGIDGYLSNTPIEIRVYN